MQCRNCTTAFTYTALVPSPEVRRAESSFHKVRIWPDFKDLDSRASSGCEFCKLFRAYLIHFISYDKLLSSSYPINLSRWVDDLGLGCKGFDGTIIVPIVHSKAIQGPHSELLKRRLLNLESVDRYEQASKWLHTCLDNHQDCRVAEYEPWLPVEKTRRPESDVISKLPKRLLDLDPAQGDVIHIINCLNWVERGLSTVTELGNYCTLSYRWGTTTHDCTLTRSFNSSMEIQISAMPATFTDAIAVARKFGLRFLWIDALCIVQPSPDSDEEWLRESARMGMIYENAIFTIAATGATSVQEGFLHLGVTSFTADACVIYDSAEVSRSLTLPVSTPSFSIHITKSALNSRGWVMQERALSRRILHFTRHGLFWECGSLKATQHTPGGLIGPTEFPSCRSKESMLKVCRIRQTQHLCPTEWFHFIKQYSYTKFTRTSDRLLALSAVARAVRVYLRSGPYLAGLWKKDLLRGLCWFTRTRDLRRPDHIVRIPSWSWASVPGGIDFLVFCIRTWRYGLAEVIDVSIRPVDLQNVFGNVRCGTLKLMGTITTRTFTVDTNHKNPRTTVYESCEYWDEVQVEHESQSEGGDDGGTGSLINSASCSPGARQTTLTRFCLPIAWCNKSSYGFSNDIVIGALILLPTNRSESSQIQSYRRVGWAEWPFFNVEYIKSSLRRTTQKPTQEFDFKRWVDTDPKEVIIV